MRALNVCVFACRIDQGTKCRTKVIGKSNIYTHKHTRVTKKISDFIIKNTGTSMYIPVTISYSNRTIIF